MCLEHSMFVSPGFCRRGRAPVAQCVARCTIIHRAAFNCSQCEEMKSRVFGTISRHVKVSLKRALKIWSAVIQICNLFQSSIMNGLLIPLYNIVGWNTVVAVQFTVFSWMTQQVSRFLMHFILPQKRVKPCFSTTLYITKSSDQQCCVKRLPDTECNTVKIIMILMMEGLCFKMEQNW